MMKLHRNSQKRIYIDGETYFVTSKTVQNFPFFSEEIFCELWLEELQLCKRLKQFDLFGFCLNQDHFHLLVRPNHKVANISQIMKSFKENISRDINYVLSQRIFEGDTSTCRLRLRDNLQKCQKQFHQKYGTQNHFPKFAWQRSFHDHYIRNPKDFANHLRYTVHNHLKHGLPESWRFTSLNFPELIDES